MRHLSKHPALLILFTLVLLMGCGGGGGGGGHTDPDTQTPPVIDNDGPITENGVDLADARPSAMQAEVFDLLKLTGLPEGSRAEDFHAEFKLTGDGPIGPGITDSGLIPILEGDGEELYLLVPLVDLEGTTIDLRITDGQSYSPTWPLTIAPLPEPEPGVLEQLLSASEELIKSTAEAYGLTYPDDLQSFIDNPQSLPPQYVPLVHGYHVLSNPDNPDKLTHTAFTDEERRDLERLIVHMSLVQEVEQLTAFANSDPELIEKARPYFDLPGELITPTPPPSLLGTQKSMVHFSAPLTAEPAIWRGLLPLNGPEDLVSYMAAYNNARATQENIETAVKLTGIGATAIGVGAAFVVSGPGGGVAVGAVGTLATAKAVGTAVTIAGVVNGAGIVARGFYPCCIHDIAMELIPESGIVAHEDAVEPSLILAGAAGVVRSEGVDLTKQILERAINIIGAAKVSKSLQDSFANNAFAEELIDAGTSALFDQLNLTGNKIIFEWSEVDLAGDDPEEWLDIDLEGFAATRSIFEQSPDHVPGNGQVAYRLNAERFFGNESAQDILRVRPEFDKYPLPLGHGALPYDHKTVAANTIDVRFDPAGIKLEEPGEVIPFTVTVTNALDTDITLPLTLEPEVGTIKGPLSDSGDDGVYEFEYVAPETQEEMPNHVVYVHADALSTGGVRSRDTPRQRRGTMRIGSDAVLLELRPQAVCLDTGDTHTFEAFDPLLDVPVDVTWSANIGSIDSNGTYTAGSFGPPGYATITATATEDSDVTATAQVTLGCDCWWSGSVSGDIGQAHAHATTSIIQGGDLAVTDILFTGYDEILGTRLVLDPPIPAGQTGTYGARTLYGGFTPDPVAGWGNNEAFPLSPLTLPPLQVQVSRHHMLEAGLGQPEGSRIMEVQVTGQVARERITHEGLVVHQGQLSLSAKGIYSWRPPMAGMLNCSPID